MLSINVINELQKHLDFGIDNYGSPGASLAIYNNGELLKFSSGVLNESTQVNATVDSIFQIGSISKVLTTTLVMQLVDLGLVRLDDAILDYLPDLKFSDAEYSRAVTIERLLSHSSGLDGDFFVDGDNSPEKHIKYLEQCGEIPFIFPPGKYFSYCNSGFVILGRLIEVITGQTWDEVLKERIFDPLGMKHSISNPTDVLRFRAAIGHVGRQTDNDELLFSPVSKPYLSQSMGPAGTTVTMSASDLIAFTAMHLNDGRSSMGEQVLSSSSVQTMHQARMSLPAYSGHGVVDCGLGWFLYNWNDASVFGHDGATVGQTSFLRIHPEKNLAVALLTNSDGRQLNEYLSKIIFGDHLGTDLPCAALPEIANYESEWCVGCYENLIFRVDVFLEHAKLYYRVSCTALTDGLGEPHLYELKAISPRVFIAVAQGDVPDIGTVTFHEDQNGSAKFLFNRFRMLKRI